MKKIALYSLAILLIFSTSCFDDFLEQYPKGRWHHGNYIDDKEIDEVILTEAKIAEAYAKLRSYEFLFPCFGMHNYTTPEGEKGSTPSDGGVIREFATMSYTSNNLHIANFYSDCYRTIYLANEALTLGNALDDTIPEKNTYLAESLFLRSVMYFRLAQAFGGVPYVNRVMEQDEKTPARSSREEIWAEVERDLLWAIPNLPTRQSLVSSGNGGRATQNAARAVLAKTYLYQEKWSATLAVTSDIIASGDNALFSPFSDIWHESNEFCSESVFEVNCEFKPSERVYLGSQCSQIQGVRGTPNLGWGFNAPAQSLIDSFEAGDPRKEASIISNGDDLDGTIVRADPAGYNYFNKKAYTPKSEYNGLFGRAIYDHGQWQNIRLIRYSDILLIHAEAACEMGNLSEALAKLEMVRARARGGNSAVLPEIKSNSVDEVRQKIRQERKVELALEWERFYDLVRWGEASKVIFGFVSGRHELFPIPATEIEKSEGILTQNPGY